MTSKGYKTLQAELHRLKTVERRRVSNAIAVARDHGDLSENAEYDAAKHEQGLIEAKIRDIETKIATAQVVEISSLSGSKVIFGATVEICDMDSDEEKRITIVGLDEANPTAGLISYQSPLARALIGKNVDDVVRVKLPGGEKEYEIRSVAFLELDQVS